MFHKSTFRPDGNGQGAVVLCVSTKQTETLIFGRNFNEIVVPIAMGNCGC